MGRNPFNKTIHYERKQSKETKGLGKLERRKDFLKRAKVKKLQEQTTMYLKQKGSNKNPDEFNMKMQNMRLQGKAVIDIRPKEGDSVQDLERLLMIQKNAQNRLKKKLIHQREKRIVFDDNGNAQEVDPIDLVDVNKIEEKLNVDHIVKEQQNIRKKIADIEREMKKTERMLMDARKVERSEDQRKKLEITDEYGDVVATYYQTPRKK